MASQGGTSRLTQMQMRFQQKQQQEREQRKIEMTGDVSSIVSQKQSTSICIDNVDKKSISSSIAPGKVRQMFDERRQRSTGIDKSYPLKPIPPRSSANSTSHSRTAPSVITTQKNQSITTTTVKHHQTNNSSTSIRQKNDVLNGNTNTVVELEQQQEQDSIDNEAFPSDIAFSPNNEILGTLIIPSKLPNVGKNSTILNRNRGIGSITDAAGDKNNNAATNMNRNQNNSNFKLKPVLTKKVPPTVEPVNRVFEKKTMSTTSKAPLSTRSNTIDNKSVTSTNSVLSPKGNMSKTPRNTMNTKGTTGSNTSSTIDRSGNNTGLAECHICHRNFNADRLEKHEKICEKTSTKKRKTFDAAKHRVAGTDAEKYVKKGVKGGASKTSTTNKSVPVAAPSKPTNNPTNAVTKASNWRKTHEEFIKTIRAAKQMQIHLAKGGKLSDLPPPPPSENLDYIQCPHCGRRFNQAAAERHIPKCATFLHNKPKLGGASSNTKKRY